MFTMGVIHTPLDEDLNMDNIDMYGIDSDEEASDSDSSSSNCMVDVPEVPIPLSDTSLQQLLREINPLADSDRRGYLQGYCYASISVYAKRRFTVIQSLDSLHSIIHMHASSHGFTIYI